MNILRHCQRARSAKREQNLKTTIKGSSSSLSKPVSIFFFITLFSDEEHDNAIQHLLWHKWKNAEGDASIRLNKARLEGMEDVELPLTFL